MEITRVAKRKSNKKREKFLILSLEGLPMSRNVGWKLGYGLVLQNSENNKKIGHPIKVDFQVNNK